MRLVDDFLAKSKAPPCASFADTADVVAKVAFKMFLGVPALVGSWSSDRRTFSLVFTDNPLAEFTELPEKWGGVWYSNVLCGVIKGALEMVSLLCHSEGDGGWRGGWFENDETNGRGGGGRVWAGVTGVLELSCVLRLLHERCSCAAETTCGVLRPSVTAGAMAPGWSSALFLELLRSLWADRLIHICLASSPPPPSPLLFLPTFYPSSRATCRPPPCRSRWRSTPALSAVPSAGRTSTKSA